MQLPKEDPKRFRLDIAFSRGTATDVRLAPPLGPDGDVIHDAYLQVLMDWWLLTDANNEQDPLTLQRFENYLWRFAKSTPGFQGAVGAAPPGPEGPGGFGIGGFPSSGTGDGIGHPRGSAPSADWAGRSSVPTAPGAARPGGGGVTVHLGGEAGSAPATPNKDPVTGALPDPGVSIAVASPKHPDPHAGGGLFR